MAKKQPPKTAHQQEAPLTLAEKIFQVNMALIAVGVLALAILASEDLQDFFSFIPPETAWGLVKIGFGIPLLYFGAGYIYQNRTHIRQMIQHLLKQRKPPEPPPPAPPRDEKLEMLPSPAQGREYSGAGQVIAQRIGNALLSLELTKDPAPIREITDGPTASRITISLPPGVRLSRIESATRDLQAAIGAPSLQIHAGMEANTAAFIVTHRKKQPVVLRQILETPDFKQALKKRGLPVPIGVNEIGTPVLTDMTRVAHILVAGATGAGKSWWLNQLLVTWALYYGPDELRLLLVDPKQVELAQYTDFPHTLMVAKTPKEAVTALKALTVEMDHRYKTFAAAGVRNIAGYRKSTGAQMPFIACVIDELADLMVLAKKEVEPVLQRLAQLGRACGIHLVVATQRPSVDVVTGVIKANLPTRVVFRLPKQSDYMTVLDEDPRVVLTGKGDGLAAIEGEFGLIRFQSAGIGVNDEQADQTIDRVKAYYRNKDIPVAETLAFAKALESAETFFSEEKTKTRNEVDPEITVRRYIAEAVANSESSGFVIPSAVELSKELSVNRPRVNEALGVLEREGWVSPLSGAGRGAKRTVLLSYEDACEWLERLENQEG